MKLWHIILLSVGVLMLIGGLLTLFLIDKPQYTVDEACTFIWAHLPAQLEGGYSKAQFVSVTREAIYQGDGKWLFEVSGSVTRSFGESGGERRPRIEIRPREGSILGEMELLWEQQYRWISERYKLELKANFYERTGIVEVTGINSTLIETSTSEWAWDN